MNEYSYYQVFICSMHTEQFNVRVKGINEDQFEEIILKMDRHGDLPYESAVLIDESCEGVSICDMDPPYVDNEFSLFELNIEKNELIKISS